MYMCHSDSDFVPAAVKYIFVAVLVVDLPYPPILCATLFVGLDSIIPGTLDAEGCRWRS